MDKESLAQNNNETNETQYYSAPPVDKEILKQRKEGEKQLKKQEITGQNTSPSPLLIIFIKEVIMVLLLVFVATRWQFEGDTGGNFGATVSAGMIFFPFAFILDAFALNTSWRTGAIIGLIALSALFNSAVFCAMPLIMQIFS